MRRSHVAFLIAALLILALFPARAFAVTVRDIIELSRAGVTDDVLIALMESDGTIFSLEARDLVQLKQSGISERVLLAMIRNGRQQVEDPARAVPTAPSSTIVPSTANEPGVVVIGQSANDASRLIQIRETVYVPFYVPVPIFGRPHVPRVPTPVVVDPGFGRFLFNNGVFADPFPSWGPNFR